MKNISEVIEKIYSYINSGEKNGLENMKILLEKLQFTKPKYKIIHIAGTNGKGSVSATLEHILFKSGYRVGKFTSPHILNINERFRFNETDISDEEFIIAFEKVERAIEDTGITPTFFEVMTGIMYEFYLEKNLDYLILETGIGGRIDSTNIFYGDYCIVTNVGFDHIDMLGDTIEKISFEKSGIVKKGSHAVVGEINEWLREEILKREPASLTIPLEKYPGAKYRLNYENFRTEIEIEGEEYSFSLFGDHQFKNFLSAFEVLKQIGVSSENIGKYCSSVFLTCRFEVISQLPLVVLDGAHNSHGIRSLKKTLETHYRPEDITVITTVLKDKDIPEISQLLQELSNDIIVTSLKENKRGLSAEELKVFFNPNYSMGIEELDDALKTAISHRRKLILVCGSFYLLSKFKLELQNGKIKI